jgi:hypothetical protein
MESTKQVCEPKDDHMLLVNLGARAKTAIPVQVGGEQERYEAEATTNLWRHSRLQEDFYAFRLRHRSLSSSYGYHSVTILREFTNRIYDINYRNPGSRERTQTADSRVA